MGIGDSHSAGETGQQLAGGTVEAARWNVTLAGGPADAGQGDGATCPVAQRYRGVNSEESGQGFCRRCTNYQANVDLLGTANGRAVARAGGGYIESDGTDVATTDADAQGGVLATVIQCKYRGCGETGVPAGQDCQ